MTKTKFLICLIIAIVALYSGSVLANDIQYPIKELGDCQNKAECKLFCDKPENLDACLSFAEENNLMSQQEIDTAKKFTAIKDKKPGGCADKNACEAYCDDISHIDECLAFAIENDLVPPEELKEAKQAQAAIKRGVKPPPCRGKKACDNYCDSPEHMEECINFAIEAGFMTEQEKTDSQKMLAAIKRGIRPPPCKGKEACDEYCSQPDNMETCMTFALEAGFMSEQEKTDAQKMLTAIKKGAKPPKCKSKEECDIYCQQEEHSQECFEFAKAAGFISDEDLQKMEQGKQQMRDSLSQAPQEVLDCLSGQIGAEKLEGLKAGTAMPSEKIGEAMRQCFEKIMPPQPEINSGGQGAPTNGPMPQIQTGPGGCASPEECQAYCQNNPQECQNFQPQSPMPNPPDNGQIYPQPTECQGPDCPSMAPPQPCEGENCVQAPAPYQQYAPSQEYAPYQQPTGEPTSQPPSYYGPMPQQTPYENQPVIQQEPLMPPQPPQYQQPPLPAENFNPPPSPSGNTAPAPEPAPEPAPTGSLAPENFLGSLLMIFLGIK